MVKRKRSIAKKIDGKFIAIALAGVFVLAAFLFSPLLKAKAQQYNGNAKGDVKIDYEALAKEVIPPEGFTTSAKWGCTGKKLVENGAIDLEKFKLLYENYGNPLTDEQLNLLTACTDETLKINAENSHFALNVLWALGLSNKNPLMDKIAAEYAEIDYLASTGGWTLGKESGGELWGKYEIAKISAEQQKIVENTAMNTYRPCCNNPTAFPDCNHGAAALGLIELMASQGFSETEIFEALKAFNSYWFPQQYFENAIYFKIKEGKDWKDVDAKTVLGKDYSSYSGWANVDSYLKSNGILEQVQSSGGSCGA